MLKPILRLRGMLGVGDCIHQRAIVREAMKTHEVRLETYYVSMFHDLVRQGLKVTPAHQMSRARIREETPKRWDKWASGNERKITYNPATVKRLGSILAAQFASAGIQMPKEPDFSLPVKPEWRSAARRLIKSWDIGDKPLMIYRPIIRNTTWDCPARSPDSVAYSALFESIRKAFFVVSVANLKQSQEWIVGGEQYADIKLHKGELTFETMAGLFAEADLVFSNPGFAPVLAQSVGTPGIIVYGGNESFRTTNSVGKHLAPTLAIEPVKPCECHSRYHACDKRIELAPALDKVVEFAGRYTRQRIEKPDMPRMLIFGTAYVDTPERLSLTAQWLRLHGKLNPECDLLLVDSSSPLSIKSIVDATPRARMFSFPDNIGHLSRNGPGGPNTGGKDGWGRAFCRGLQEAIDGAYDYVAHIEGDSLFRLPVESVVSQMKKEGIDCVSVPVNGTVRVMPGWVETGLMFFRVGYLGESEFIARYDWPHRTAHPTPEVVIRNMLGKHLRMMPWRAERGDKNQITMQNVSDLDWVTHCPFNPKVYDKYLGDCLREPTATAESAEGVKLNFGCGTNRLGGWRNFDNEIDISKKLKFPSSHADYILAEHVVEHVDYYRALDFFKECRRVLKPGGVLRIAVPSLERIWKHGDEEYFKFSRKWAPDDTVRGAMHAILYAHGHKTAWTDSLLEASLFYAGFDTVTLCEPGKSRHAELVGVEGHGRVIGERMNWIETTIVEAA